MKDFADYTHAELLDECYRLRECMAGMCLAANNEERLDGVLVSFSDTDVVMTVGSALSAAAERTITERVALKVRASIILEWESCKGFCLFYGRLLRRAI